MNQFEITGQVTFIEPGGAYRVCHKVCACSPMGVETWLYVDTETGELYLAEQLDGEWTVLDNDYAERFFADVLYAVR